MNELKLKEELLKLEKKMTKDHSTKELVQELISLSERNDQKGLEFKFKELALHRQAIISQKKSDEDLNALNEEKERLEKPYKEQMKQNELKSRFIGLLLQQLNNFGD